MYVIYFDYSQFTLGEIEKYRYSTFEFDGDSKKIKVSIPEKKGVEKKENDTSK